MLKTFYKSAPQRGSKELLIASLAAIVLLSAGTARAVENASSAAFSSAVRTTGIPVRGVVCPSCAAVIKQKIKKLDGVADVEIMFAERLVRITYSSSRPDLPSRAVAAINALGYKAGTPGELP